MACDSAPTYAQTQTLLKRWLPDEGDQERALAEVPARLFGFGIDLGREHQVTR